MKPYSPETVERICGLVEGLDYAGETGVSYRMGSLLLTRDFGFMLKNVANFVFSEKVDYLKLFEVMLSVPLDGSSADDPNVAAWVAGLLAGNGFLMEDTKIVHDFVLGEIREFVLLTNANKLRNVVVKGHLVSVPAPVAVAADGFDWNVYREKLKSNFLATFSELKLNQKYGLTGEILASKAHEEGWEIDTWAAMERTVNRLSSSNELSRRCSPEEIQVILETSETFRVAAKKFWSPEIYQRALFSWQMSC